MAKMIKVATYNEVEACERCEKKPRQFMVTVWYTPVGGKVDDEPNKRAFLCETCADTIAKAFTIRRKKKATPKAPATLET